MIRNSMRDCNYYEYKSDAYGSSGPSSTPGGKIKMSVHLTDYDTQQNVLFSGSGYLGLTHDDNINQDWYVDIGQPFLAQITYIIKGSRYNQVFMKLTGNKVPLPLNN